MQKELQPELCQMVRSQLELVCPREKQRVQRLEVSELLVRVEVWQQSLVQLVEKLQSVSLGLQW